MKITLHIIPIFFLLAINGFSQKVKTDEEKIPEPYFTGTFGYSFLGKGYHHIGAQLILFNLPAKNFSISHIMGVSFCPDDKFNNNSGNSSILSFLSAFFFVNLYDDSSHFNMRNRFYLSLLFSTILNTKLTYYFHQEENYKYTRLPTKGMGIFVSNSTDFYMFRRQKYLSFNPAIGLTYIYKGLTFDLGYSPIQYYDFKSFNRDDQIYFSLRFSVVYMMY